MRKFSKTKKIKKTKRIKKQKRNKKIIKTRKFIRIGGGIVEDMFTTGYKRDALKVYSAPTSTTLMKKSNPITELKPIRVNTIDGDAIYCVKIEGCDYYFFGQHMKYVIIGDTKQIFKLDEGAPDLQDDMIAHLKDINFTKLTAGNKYDYYLKIRELVSKNILYFSHGKCHAPNFNLDAAKEKLIDLNKSLQDRCSNLSLYIDYIYNHPDDSTLELFKTKLLRDSADPSYLVLCLYEGKHCISSITIIYKSNEELDLASYTNKKNENKKYNILLRSVLIIISKLLSSDFLRIKTYALNLTSAYIFIKHFGAILDEDDENTTKFLEFSNENDMPFNDPKTNLYNLLYLAYYNVKYLNLIIIVELSDDNIENAENKFDEILHKIVCEHKSCLLGTMNKCLHFLQ